MNYRIVLLLITIFFTSCSYFIKDETPKDAIARVGNTFLLKKDLKEAFPKKITPKDSIVLVESYINGWIKHTLLLQKAEMNLVDKKEEIKKRVQRYKEDLLINSYKQSVVKEYLDANITEADITKYYITNRKNFKLNEELLQLRYIKFPKDVLHKKEFIKYFKSNKNEDIDSLKANKMSFKSYHFNDSVWVKYNDVVKKIPILLKVNKKQLLKNNTFVKKEDSVNTYLIKIKNVRFKQQTAPKNFIKKNIEELILHNRKKELLGDIEEKLINDAKQQKYIELIKNNKN